MSPSSLISTIQAPIMAAVAQIAALAVTFGWLNTSREEVIINAAAALFSVAVVVANAFHAQAAAKVQVAALEAGVANPAPAPAPAPAPVKRSRAKRPAVPAPPAE